jgi:hypothetical protein
VAADGTIILQDPLSGGIDGTSLGTPYPMEKKWEKKEGNEVLEALKKMGTPEAIEAIKRIWKRYNLVTPSPTFKCKISGCTGRAKTKGGMCRDCEHDEL